MSNTLYFSQVADTVSLSEQSIALDPSLFCGPPQAGSQSPIDDFYTYLKSAVMLGSQQALDQNDILGKVLLLGIVSAAEQYFRSVIAGLVNVCPLARKAAGDHQIAFAATDYYKKEDLGFAFLEGVSLATAGLVGKKTSALTGCNSQNGGSARSAILEYEKLYQLRHAAVHSRGELGSQNLRDMGVDLGGGPRSLKVDYQGFQLACAVCQNAVRAYNRAIFAEVLDRWTNSSLLLGTWRDDRKCYSKLFRFFHSNLDTAPQQDERLSYAVLKPLILRRLSSPASVNIAAQVSAASSNSVIP